MQEKNESLTNNTLVYTDLDLALSHFPQPKFLVPGLISEGLSILAGKAKMGKSILAYNLSLSLAAGQPALGTIPVDQCTVLYLALEEHEGRLNSKLSRIRGSNPPTNNIHFAFKWPRMDEGGLENLKAWIEVHPSVKLIVIDTFTKFRSLKSNGTLYNKDYVEISSIKRIADRHSLAIVVIHHLRKSSAKDALDMITGSTGLSGASDSLLILSRKRSSQEAELFIAGRDVEEQNLALEFEPLSLSWTLIGQAEKHRMSKERQEVVKMLESAPHPLQLKDIASALGKKGPVVHKHLSLLIECGFVEQTDYGKYQIKKSDKTGESGESENPDDFIQ